MRIYKYAFILVLGLLACKNDAPAKITPTEETKPPAREERKQLETTRETAPREVDQKGMVIIPAASKLRPSYQGTLIRIWHELIVYILDSRSKSVIATTQPIPVDFDPPKNGQQPKPRYTDKPGPPPTTSLLSNACECEQTNVDTHRKKSRRVKKFSIRVAEPLDRITFTLL